MSIQINDSSLTVVAHELGDLLLQKGWCLATAESCTGGGIAHAITSVAGSSAWFDCGFVTYSNGAKTRLLGVDASLIKDQGAVSQAVVEQMAIGATVNGQVDIAVAVTGIAGPGGGHKAKPVGTVWLGWVYPGHTISECRHFEGDREAVRQQTVQYALQRLLDLLKSES